MKCILIFCTLIVYTLSVDPYSNPAFINIGQFGQSFYYVPRYFITKWTEARSLCKAYGYDLAALDTQEEFDAVRTMCKNNTNAIKNYVFIDGILVDPAKKFEWYLTTSGQKITYLMKFNIGEPNNDGGKEFYLSLAKPDFLFNDIRNDDFNVNFLCEKKI